MLAAYGAETPGSVLSWAARFELSKRLSKRHCWRGVGVPGIGLISRLAGPFVGPAAVAAL